MLARQTSRIGMYHAVINYCAMQSAIVATIPAFAAAFASFQSIVQQITTAAARQSSVITGVSTNKENLRKQLAAEASTMAAIVFAYAAAQNNNTLKEQVRYSYTKILRHRDEEVASVAQIIHKAATNNSAALSAYGITPATLTTFQNTINTYQAAVPAPRVAIVNRITYKKQVSTLFLQAGDVLKNQLDKMAIQFKTTHPDFYSNYINSRIIIDPHTSHTQVAGIVQNKSKEPIRNAEIIIANTAYHTTTNEQGKFKIKIPQPGLYILQCSSPGYTDVTAENMQLKLGKTKRIRITLHNISS